MAKAEFILKATVFPLQEMEEDDEKRSDANSFRVLNTNLTDLNKKRKLQADQLNLPLSKHKCSNHRLSHDDDCSAEEFQQEEDFYKHIPYGINEDQAPDESVSTSAMDSNSISGESDSALSINNKPKFEPELAHLNSSDGFSTSFNGNDGFEASQNLEQLSEVKNHLDHICSEYAKDEIAECKEEGTEDMVYFNGVTSTSYVLSSGRWSVNQEGQMGTKKPTIDQEFEQYFSMLML